MNSYLTKERLEELKEELKRLKQDERSEISDRLKKAKEYGDLSENAEYIDAKEEQAKLEGRIFELEEVIRNAVIIKKSGGKTTVSIGSTIEVKKNGNTVKYTIVGSSEAKPELNLISNESPLGKNFIGKKVGDVVDVETPSGKFKYKIMRIE